MAEYTFHCSDCDEGFTIHQSMHAKLPRTCPTCRGTENFGTVIQAPIGTRGEPRTVGSLAEKNTKKLCKEDYDRIMAQGKSDTVSPAMRKRIEENGGTVKKREMPTGNIPWYRNGSVAGTERLDKPLDLSKVKDIGTYVKTGKKT